MSTAETEQRRREYFIGGIRRITFPLRRFCTVSAVLMLGLRRSLARMLRNAGAAQPDATRYATAYAEKCSRENLLKICIEASPVEADGVSWGMLMNTAPVTLRSVIAAVDDDQDDIDLMRLLFRKAEINNPFQVYGRGEDVVAALTAVMESPVDAALPLVCFVDVKMPAMSGHDVLRWIRAQRPLDVMPVVMLTSSEHPADLEQAARNGAQCYIAKYPQPAVLRQVLAEAERFATDAPEKELFRLPSNLLLKR